MYGIYIHGDPWVDSGARKLGTGGKKVGKENAFALDFSLLLFFCLSQQKNWRANSTHNQPSGSPVQGWSS